MTEIATVSAVRDLRYRWKPHKERLAALKGEQSTSIRFHRACSWMARVEQMPISRLTKRRNRRKTASEDAVISRCFSREF